MIYKQLVFILHCPFHYKGMHDFSIRCSTSHIFSIFRETNLAKAEIKFAEYSKLVPRCTVFCVHTKLTYCGHQKAGCMPPSPLLINMLSLADAMISFFMLISTYNMIRLYVLS